MERIDSCWKLGQSVAHALLLTLFTAQRSGEVVEMDWGEVDLAQKVWKQPKEKTKNETPNVVPLNGLAVEILEERNTADAQNNEEEYNELTKKFRKQKN